MDHSQAKWLSEMQMDVGDSALTHEWHMKSTDHLSGDVLVPQASRNGIAKPAIQFKNNTDWIPYNSADETNYKASSSASTNMISFGNSNSTPMSTHQYHYNGKPTYNIKTEAMEMMPLEKINFSSSISDSSFEELYGAMAYGDPSKKGGGTGTRTSIQAKEHVLAERKRREKLTRQFVALSSMIPGLEKLDKSSIIGGAMNYIKEIEEENKRIYEELAVHSKRCRLSSYHDDTSSSNENFDSSLESCPKIEVRIFDDNVVFIIDCKEVKGIIDEISDETKKLHLRVINSCSVQLGNSKLLLTILAKHQKKKEMSILKSLLNLDEGLAYLSCYSKEGNEEQLNKLMRDSA